MKKITDPSKTSAMATDLTHTPKTDLYPDRETLLQILNAMYDELYVIDAEGTCIYVNRACVRHYNLEPHQVIGQKLIDSVHNGYWSPGIGLISVCEKRTATYEMRSNTNKVLLVTATPVFDDIGNVTMIVENLRDIHELVRNKVNLDEAQILFDKYYSYDNIPQVRETAEPFIAESKIMRQTLHTADIIAGSRANSLLTGPTGSGKNLLARYIHEHGSNREGPFITVNCAAIPEQLFESEFFGYVHGAFSGASLKGKKGIVALAQGGTLFLDEINSIPLYLQAKLLHFLEERTYAPIGSNKACHSTCRILAATNQNIQQLIQEKHFREDLFYRLSVLELAVPGLQERQDDILPLIQFFLKRFNAQMHSSCALAADALTFLARREWPGNVRELENSIERITAMSQGQVLTASQVRDILQRTRVAPLPERKPVSARPDLGGMLQDMTLDEALELVERTLVQKAHADGKSSYKVANALGINQNRAYRLLKKYL